jgi:hypothetical protein
VIEPRYSTRTLELFRELPGAGALPAGEGRIAVGEAASLDRGAWVRFEARILAGRIAECRFQAWGCPHTLAAAAMARIQLLSQRGDAATAVEAAQLARELDAPAGKMGRMLVVEDAARALLSAAARVQ